MTDCHFWGIKNPGKLVGGLCCNVVEGNGSGILIWKDPRVWVDTGVGWEEAIRVYEMFNTNWDKTAAGLEEDGCPTPMAIREYALRLRGAAHATCSPPEKPGTCPKLYPGPKIGLASEGEPLPALVGVSIRHSHLIIKVKHIVWPRNCLNFTELEQSIQTLINVMLQRLPKCYKYDVVRKRRDLLSDIAGWVGATGSTVNAISLALESNNRDWADNLLATGTISVAKGGLLSNQATRHLASATHDTGEVITVLLQHLLENNKIYEKILVGEHVHRRMEEMCYRAGVAFSMEVAALIGDLLASRVPGWVRSAVLLDAESAPWVAAGEGSLSIVGACHDGETIRGGVLIPVGRKPILKAQPIHPLPFPCNGHVCRARKSNTSSRTTIRALPFQKSNALLSAGGYYAQLPLSQDKPYRIQWDLNYKYKYYPNLLEQ